MADPGLAIWIVKQRLTEKGMNNRTTMCGVANLQLMSLGRDAGRTTAVTATTNCRLHRTGVIRPRGIKARGPRSLGDESD